MQVESGFWDEILKGVCCKENEIRLFGSCTGGPASPAGLHRDTLGLLVLFSESDLIRRLLDGGCRMGRPASWLIQGSCHGCF